MYYVVVCSKCKKSKIVKASTKVTTCPYCGNQIRVRENVVYTCESIEVARKFKAMIDANP